MGSKLSYPAGLPATTQNGLRVYLVDKSGTIRYRNVGLSDGIEEILEAQIAALAS